MNDWRMIFTRVRGAMLAGMLVAGGPVLAFAQESEAEKPAEDEPELVIPEGFETWKAAFKKRALKSGVREETFNEALADVEPDIKVIERDAFQPEFVRPLWDYFDGAVSRTRVSNGEAMLRKHGKTLRAIEKRFGVDRQVVTAIWGLESSYGALQGKYDIFRSLATLAFQGRRRDFGESQLLAALKIVQSGDRKAREMTGSWAGAMGHTQFIPTTFLAYAVDFDGDGRRDIWSSIPDALGSTANLLAEAGWANGERWGREVKLPDGFDYALAGYGPKKTVDAWSKLGVTRATGNALPRSDFSSSILLPAGYQGPAFLIYRNYRTILEYNRATAYALAVSHLSDRLRGRPDLVQSWPRHLKLLTRSERVEVQELLNKRGFPVGEVDGVIGRRSRGAIRDFQKSIGVPADGFPTNEVLEQLRAGKAVSVKRDGEDADTDAGAPVKKPDVPADEVDDAEPDQ